MRQSLTAFCLSLPILLQAQEKAPMERPKLSADTVARALKTLDELERNILSRRSSTLGGIIAKLADASASNAAAVRFYTDCDNLVNAERKDVSKAEARARAEQIERSMEQARNKKGNAANEDLGDPAIGLRFGLRYLMLTLEAHETKDEQFEKLVPKLQAYIKDLVDAAPQLKGRALGMIQRACADGGPVVQAYQLERYLQRPQWSRDATRIGEMYEQSLLKLAKPEQIASLWDLRLQQEAVWSQGLRTEAEHNLWLQNELPMLRWKRGLDLYQRGSDTMAAMAALLKVIQEFPAHADAPKWVSSMRQLVNESAEIPTSGEAPKS